MMKKLSSDSSETVRLLKLARTGDSAAFGLLFTRHRRKLRGFVDNRLDDRLRSRMDPSDIVQETQIEAFRRFNDFYDRRPMPFHIWLRKTAYDRLLNLNRDHVRTQRRSLDRERRLPDHSSELIASSVHANRPTPSETVAQKEYCERVSRIVAQLPEAEREVLLMRNVEGLSHIDIAHLLDIDHAAARKRYARALVRLEQLMLEQGLTGTE
jgi:RNA polymerase sigma-70 factor (ECF subfamily)